jgi:VIT1/CCC1 family predicted Fe2+/Mn2+ transporter
MKRKISLFETASLVKDAILSANDGIITTFAVVAGAYGANLGHNTVILLGLANLIADGISMASGNFLGVESENEILKTKQNSKYKLSPAKSGALTFGAFIFSGTIPLIPYMFFESNTATFVESILMVLFSLIMLGFVRGWLTKKSTFRLIIETVLVGGIAAIAAYSIGYWGDRFLRG